MTASGTTILRLDRLSRYFKKLAAVSDLSLSLEAGEIVALLGPNGAGKTTALRCIAGLLQPTSGTIEVAGINVAANPIEAKRSLAYVPEVPAPYDLLTVEEQLQFITRAYGLKSASSEITKLLERFELDGKRREFCVTLSKGMKQKLALACAFVRRPALYLLDEPLIGIDPRGAKELKDLVVERSREGSAIVVSTHMLDTAERLASRMMILDRGRLLAEGSLKDLHEEARLGSVATLEEVFLKLTMESEESRNQTESG